MEWIKSEELPTWEWHEDTSVIPHAWWYGDNSVSPAVSYAKNEYVKIGKNYEYFNNDGFWEDYKAMPHADCDWYEAQDGSGRKWFGYRKGYYAHNEYVYMTVEGQMKEWWYDEEGWYDESRSGDSDMGWHGDATSGYWFGEADATSEDTNKFLHDRWAWIDGNYYWFDKYGYISGELDIPDYPWFVIETTQGSWFGNDQDEMLGAKWFANQWAKIDGEWYYFDADGYVVDMTAKKSETIAWFANTVYNNTIAYITTCLTNAYTLLYRLMTEWCEKQYADGIDLPTVNVSVDLIDLSKTTEYKDYSNLEKISLGDKVLVIGRDGSRYEERVVGLTFDCIRGYNTQIEVGQLSKSVSQIINVSYSGASEGQKIIAGDGVTIDGKVISVGDYVGRTIGLQDVLLNGSTCVSGNVASFGIQAGENISISRDGNTLTINSTAEEGNKVYVGADEPSPSIGGEHDIYFKYGLKTEDILSEDRFEGQSSGSHITTLTDFEKVSRNEFNFKINGNPDGEGNGETAVFLLDGLVVGNTYHISFDAQYSGESIYFPYPANEKLSICGVDIPMIENTNKNHYEADFVYTEDGEARFTYYKLRDNIDFTVTYTDFTITGNFTSGIEDLYDKINGKWERYEGGETYEAGDNILIEDNVISGNYQPFEGTDGTEDGESGLVPQPLTTDADKFLKSDGTWAEVQSGGGGSNLIVDAQIYSLEEKQIGVWVDGRPLYQKTFETSITLQSAVWTVTGDSILNGKAIDAEVTLIGQVCDTVPVWCEIGADGHIELLNIRSVGQVTITHYTVRYFKTTDTAGSGGFQAYGFTPIIYSTEEREVGVWIDNKPLYAKSFTFSSQLTVSASSWTNTDLSLSNVEKFVNGYAISDDGTFQGSVVVDKSNDVIQLQSTRSSASYVKYLTVFYTKTTDIAGSAQYTTLGVPAVHYDGNEKIVGTYFGETLYERTLNFTQDNSLYYIPNTTYVKKLVKHNGECTKDNFDFQIPYYDGADYLSVGNDTNGVRIYSSNYFVGAVYELTIQYTKTS